MATVTTRDFSSQGNLDVYLAETAAREAEETRRREEHAARETADREALTQAARELPTTSKFDWMALATLDEHPLLVAAREAASAAEARVVAATTAVADAEAHLHRVEDAAARGRRDDAALTQALTRIEAARMELRIATRSAEQASDSIGHVYRAVNAACTVNLHRQHDEAVQALNKVLGEAQVLSQRAAAIEDKSRTLLPSGPYARDDRRLGQPVPLVAWRKEFGPRGYLSYWRQYFKLPG